MSLQAWLPVCEKDGDGFVTVKGALCANPEGCNAKMGTDPPYIVPGGGTFKGCGVMDGFMSTFMLTTFSDDCRIQPLRDVSAVAGGVLLGQIILGCWCSRAKPPAWLYHP